MVQNPRYRPASGLVSAITILMLAEALLALLSIWSTWREVQLLERIKAKEHFTEAEAEASVARQATIGIVQTGAAIGLAIVFLVWLNRANKNARALGAQGMQFTPGWAVGWFFVPIANLFKPFQAVQEIWRASHPDYGEHWRQAPSSPLLGFWWGLWIISNVVAQIALRASLRAEDAQELIVSSWLGIASEMVDLPLIALALSVVWRIHGMQERKQAFGIPEPLPEVTELPEA